VRWLFGVAIFSSRVPLILVSLAIPYALLVAGSFVGLWPFAFVVHFLSCLHWLGWVVLLFFSLVLGYGYIK